MKTSENKIEDIIGKLRYARADYATLTGEMPKKMLLNEATYRLIKGAIQEVFGTTSVSIFQMGISVHEDMEDGEIYFAPF